MSTQRLSLVGLLLALLVSSAFGGKLGRIRDRASGAKASRSNSSASPTPEPPSNSQSEPEPARSGSRGRESKPSTSRAPKLRQIVSEVRPQRVTTTAPSRPRRKRRTFSGPRRSVGFAGRFHTSVCPTPVIEEHHYYQPPAVVLEAPYPPPVPAPPMEVEPAPITQILDQPFEERVSDPVVESCDTSWMDPWYVRFGIDYASDVDDVSRFGFDLLANATGGLGIDTGARLFRERGQDYRDHLWIGDFNIVYELMPTDWLRPRAGVGVNWLADAFGADAGLNLTCGADVLLGPVTIAGELDFGTLGAADLVHWRATAGVMQNESLEWFAGYDHLEIGGVEVRGVVAGLRIRF